MTVSTSHRHVATAPRTKAATALVLVNLGTPDAPEPAAVRRYLAEFLSDPRVVELPRWLWWPILHGIVLRTRPRRSAHAYASIWMAQGSPLLVHSRALAEAVGARLADSGIPVALAMRYGKPGLRAVLENLRVAGVGRFVLMPLYPQYAGATTGSTIDLAQAVLGNAMPPALHAITDYHAHPAYIGALADHLQDYWREHERAQKLLLSFHGLPQRAVDRGDPYFAQCQQTARLLRTRLGLDAGEIEVAFQSRVGAQTWLRPYTEDVLAQWPAKGVREIQVLCPGFAVDCLETLEEIAQRGGERFLAAGGTRFEYIPALNATPAHAAMIAALVHDELAAWNAETATMAHDHVRS